VLSGLWVLKVGDCMTEIPADGAQVMSVKTVPCDQPHVGEVDESYSPSAARDPNVGIYVLYPTAQTWVQGDRAVTCIATTESAQTGSVKD
jgi:hypothetical protein